MAQRYKLVATLLFALAALCSADAPAEQPSAAQMSYLDNGKVKVGVDFSLGGAITWLSKSGGENIVNSHDCGRQIQQSYYAGPQPFGEAHPGWNNWPWNPITSGDVYNHRGRTMEQRNNGKTLYVKSTPMQWALNDVPGDCTFECWLSLDGNQVRVRNRLTNSRTDRAAYAAREQELPAVYTTGKYHRLFTYDGPAPFTGSPLRELQNQGPPWTNWIATEHWAALVDASGWGLGVIHPGVLRWWGGFHGQRNAPGKDGPLDDATGYISPVRKEILDHNIVYEYEYRLVLGTLDEIRAAARKLRPDPRPDWHWDRDRQHWLHTHVEDQGWPVEGAWRLKLEQKDPQLFSPDVRFSATDVPRLILTAAFRTRHPRVELFWTTSDKPTFSPEQRLALDIIPDGKVRSYVFEMKHQPGWAGTITALRIDPTPSGSPGETAEFHSFSWNQKSVAKQSHR